MTLDDTALAIRGRFYQRERECQSSLRTFLTAVPTAHVRDQAIVMDIRPARTHDVVESSSSRGLVR